MKAIDRFEMGDFWIVRLEAEGRYSFGSIGIVWH